MVGQWDNCVWATNPKVGVTFSYGHHFAPAADPATGHSIILNSHHQNNNRFSERRVPQTNTATSTFLIEGPDKEIHRITGVNRVPGQVASLSSFHAELCGIEGTLSMIKAIVIHHQIKSGKMKIGLDNDTAQQKSDPNSIVGV